MSELNQTKKRGKNKKKGMEDNVNEANVGGVGSEDFQPANKKRRRNKDKNRQDDLAEGTIDAPPKSKKRKNKNQQEQLTTVN